MLLRFQFDEAFLEMSIVTAIFNVELFTIGKSDRQIKLLVLIFEHGVNQYFLLTETFELPGVVP